MADKRKNNRGKNEIKKETFGMSTFVPLMHIEIDSDETVSLDCVQAIMQYESDKIKLNMGKKIVVIDGDCLEIQEYSEAGTVIVGKIISLSFE